MSVVSTFPRKMYKTLNYRATSLPHLSAVKDQRALNAIAVGLYKKIRREKEYFVDVQSCMGKRVSHRAHAEASLTPEVPAARHTTV